METTQEKMRYLSDAEKTLLENLKNSQPQKKKRLKKMDVVVKLYNLNYSRIEIAKVIQRLEFDGQLTFKQTGKARTLKYHTYNIRWYISQAAKLGLIEKKYRSKIQATKERKIKKEKGNQIFKKRLLK